MRLNWSASVPVVLAVWVTARRENNVDLAASDYDAHADTHAEHLEQHEQQSVVQTSATCDEGQYCSGHLSFLRGSCDGECLPCNVEPGGLDRKGRPIQNLMRCRTCELSEGSVTCVTCNDASSKAMVTLASPPDLNIPGPPTRSYCRPPTIEAGVLPGLCSMPGGDKPSAVSLGEIWQVEDENGMFVDKRVRLRPYGAQDHTFYLAIFPPEMEITTHWPQAGLMAGDLGQMLVFDIRRGDKIAVRYNRLGNDASYIWRLSEAHMVDDYEYELDLEFAVEVRNGKDESLMEPSSLPSLRLREPALEALGACFEFMQEGQLPPTEELLKEEVLQEADIIIADREETHGMLSMS